MTEAQSFCANHPTTATQLRCNRCGKAICSKCAVRGHRARHLPTAAASGAVAGTLPFVVPGVIGFAVGLGGVQGAWMGALGLLWPAVYGFLIVSSLYWRLRGIRV